MKEVQYINPNLFSPQDAWGKLSLAEKSAMIEAGVANGLTKLSDIRERYNSFAMGGEEDNPNYGGPLIQQANKFEDGGNRGMVLPEVEITASPIQGNPIYGSESTSGFNYKAVSAKDKVGFGQIVPSDIMDAAQYALSYLDSPGFIRRAEEHGYDTSPSNNLGRADEFYIVGTNQSPRKSASGEGLITIGLDSSKDSVNWSLPGIAAHEIDHQLQQWNHNSVNALTGQREAVITDESPYYGHDYSGIPQEYKDILLDFRPGVEINKHDLELNENHADLTWLRQFAYDIGLFDSREPNSVFLPEHLEAIRQYLEQHPDVQVPRYIKNHTDDSIIRAMNEVAMNQYTSSNNITAFGGPLIQQANRI